MLDSKFLERIKKLLSSSVIFNIWGESRTGKTALALHLIGELPTDDDSCIWAQAGEVFPSRRLSQIYRGPQLQGIIDRTYIIPKGPIQTYQEQTCIIKNLIHPDTILPPELKIIVIDDISHHLRLEVGNSDIKKKCNTQDRFYGEQLFPLISLCTHESISLILIHEVTYDPSTDRTRPFFYKLYDRIRGINIIMRNKYNSKNKEMEVSFDNSSELFQYEIDERGIAIH